MPSTSGVNRLIYLITGSILLIIVLSISYITKQWVLTGVGIGFLFGFFLQKGDLCGASALSEIMLFYDFKKIFGIWVIVITSMCGFAILDIVGIVKLSPKPLLLLNYIIGGIIFGSGTVLAGGCVSGCLYKAGGGNLNSMAALVGMPIGISMVEYGILRPINEWITTQSKEIIQIQNYSLDTITGIPFWVWPILFVTATVILRAGKMKKIPKVKKNDDQNLLDKISKPWEPWKAGIAIGLVITVSYLSSAASGRNYPLGVTHGVLQIENVLMDRENISVWSKSVVQPPMSSENHNKEKTVPSPTSKKVVWWLVFVVAGTVVGAWTAAKISGKAKLLPKPPEEIVAAFLGGILTGIGAAIATGCIVGNIMSGWALLSIGMFIFGIFTALANWVVTYFYLRGTK